MDGLRELPPSIQKSMNRLSYKVFFFVDQKRSWIKKIYIYILSQLHPERLRNPNDPNGIPRPQEGFLSLQRESPLRTGVNLAGLA